MRYCLQAPVQGDGRLATMFTPNFFAHSPLDTIVMNDNTPITHSLERHRFELQIEGHIAYEEYFHIPQGLVFAHTIVPPELGGRGIASRLVQHALAWAREQGLKVRPDCSFVRAYMDKHPEYADMRLPL